LALRQSSMGFGDGKMVVGFVVFTTTLGTTIRLIDGGFIVGIVSTIGGCGDNGRR